MLIERRPCKIGPSINSRTERHGDDDVLAFDIPLSSIMLNAGELNEILNEPNASEILFDQRTDGLKEPLFKNLKAFQIEGKFEDSTLSLAVGLKQELLEFTNVTLKSLKLEPKVGGLTELSLTVRCTPELDHQLTTLFAFMNHDAEVYLEIGESTEKPSKQPELPLDASESESPPKKRGRPRKATPAGDALN